MHQGRAGLRADDGCVQGKLQTWAHTGAAVQVRLDVPAARVRYLLANAEPADLWHHAGTVQAWLPGRDLQCVRQDGLHVQNLRPGLTGLHDDGELQGRLRQASARTRAHRRGDVISLLVCVSLLSYDVGVFLCSF